ncbi:MAG: hypothetical protein P3W87_004815, partial [Gammaproteobacteria bacterium]|nr:hypothetical protein [Gammaproteobacteria bacterium]
RDFCRLIASEHAELGESIYGVIEGYLHLRHAQYGLSQAAVKRALRSAERDIRATDGGRK